MANPSTTGAGGAGTEVLRRAYTDNLGASTVTLLDCPANHIFTILTVFAINRTAGSLIFDFWVDYNAGGVDIYLLDTMTIGAKDTFILNDRFVITDADEIQCYASGTGIDVWITYIDQQVA